MSDFERIAFLDEPALTGAQWWQKSVQGELSRRAAIVLGAGLAGLAIGGIALVASCNDDPSTDNEVTENRASLDMQRRYGWSFGANGEVLTLEGVRAESDPLAGQAQRKTLTALSIEPTDAALKPFYQAALLEVPSATPIEPPPADTTPLIPFVEAYVPILERDLETPFGAGLALSRLFARMTEKCALVIDLTGAHAMALAAGVSDRFAPVLIMPNWPHPRGVVRSHQALAALSIFHPLFDDNARARPAGAPPAFVLDADRALPVASEQRFDNRYRAALPPATVLQQLGIQHLFYVRPAEASANDSKDVHARFSEYAAAGVPVRMLYAADFLVREEPSVAQSNLPTPVAPPAAALPSRYATLGARPFSFGGETDDLPAFRATYFGGPGAAYGKGATWKPAAPDPAEANRSIGMVPVVVAGGIILGAQMARQRDSWSRSFGGGGG